MPHDIVVPELGESVLDATLVRWLKQEGNSVSIGEPVAELETDKVDVEVSAKHDGVLSQIRVQAGDEVHVGDVIATVAEAEAGGEEAAVPSQSEAEAAPRDAGRPEGRKPEQPSPSGRDGRPVQEEADETEPPVTPVARRFAEEQGVDLQKVQGSGPGSRVTRQDVESYLAQRQPQPERPAARQPQAEERQAPLAQPRPTPQPPAAPAQEQPGRREERERMSRRRQTIARRLVEAQQTAAMLTTFNEVDMAAVMELRRRHKAAFQERHATSLGIASFFVKASIGALKAFPRLNAEIQGDEMVLKHYYDIGMAIGAEEGLVVPVIHDADRLSFAEVEQAISAYVDKSRNGALTLDDLRGGTFTITNGGVFGSLLSTPILNPPQVGILGLHKIEERPVVVEGQIVVRPMMYVALSYDHRIVDGREAVQFLVRVKELIEDPEKLLLEG